MYSQSENTNYYIKFPYTDKKNKPLKIWENLNEILEVNNISVMYNEIAKDIENINPSLGGFEELGIILSMPDELFATLAPIFLDELQKSFNNIGDKLTLV